MASPVNEKCMQFINANAHRNISLSLQNASYCLKEQLIYCFISNNIAS